MLSWGMLTSLADSMAALSRMLPLGSPPPARAATVISRRILEKSLPRCTSALPFLRLIWDHREGSDIVVPSFVGERCLEMLHASQPALASGQRGLPASPFDAGGRREWTARPGPQVLAQVHAGQVGRARVSDFAGPRLLG